MKIKRSQLRSLIRTQLLREQDEDSRRDARLKRRIARIQKRLEDSGVENAEAIAVQIVEDDEEDTPQTPAESDETAEEVEWDEKTYTLDDKQWPFQIGEKGPKDGPIGKLQAAVGAPADGWYGPNTGDAIGNHPDVDQAGKRVMSVGKELYNKIINNPVKAASSGTTSGGTSDDEETAEVETTDTADFTDVSVVGDRVDAYGIEWVRGFQDGHDSWTTTKTAEGSLQIDDEDVRYVRIDDSDTIFADPEEGKDSEIPSDATLTAAGDTSGIPQFEDIENEWRAAEPAPIEESISRAKLRSMILREILRRR